MCKRRIRFLACLLVLGVVGSAMGELVGHWKLDETTGTTFLDSSGKGNNGNLIAGQPAAVAGVKDGAWEFHGLGVSGGGGDTISVAHSASLDITSQISIALWIRPGADDPEGKATTTAPMAKALSTASPSWSFQVRYGWNSPQPYMSFTFNTTPRAWAYVGKKLTRDEWSHIACSFDGATLTSYLNGEKAQSTPMGPITSSPTPVLIGSDGWGCDWIGAIDDVRMYNTSLTADQIAELCPPPRTAKNPNPTDGAADVITPLFRWEAGYRGVMHEVYLGTTPDLGPADLVRPRSPLAMYWHAPGIEAGKTYYWRVDEIEADMTTVNPGIVWSFTTQALTAYLPKPADGATDVSLAPALAWAAGQAATKHHVYFGKDAATVTQGAAATDKGEKAETTFAPGALDPLTTYYWRVDEVVAGGAIKTGPVWSFSTYQPVDDFESYTDEEGGRIYETWIDGWTNSTGSTVGNTQAPFAERTIIHGGAQAMPLDYNNVNTPFLSEAEQTFAPVKDWAAGGVDTLVLYLQGRYANKASLVYVMLQDASNKTAFVATADTVASTRPNWTEWKIPLSEFSAGGVNLARVKTLVIGVGDKANPAQGGAGRMYIDDIYLTKPAQN